MTHYFNVRLPKRLEAFRRNGKKHLGGNWLDDQKKFHYVPESLTSFGGCWGGAVFKVGSTNCRFCEDLSGYFRHVTDADDVVRLNHTGWYVDCHQDETTRGLVLQLPSRGGQTLFMAACSDPVNPNTGIVEEQYLYDDREECARCADALAEWYAEGCREDDQKQRAEMAIEDLQQEIEDNRSHIRELVAGLRESKLAKVVCEEMRSTLRELRAECRAAKARIAKIQDEPWILDPNY